MKVAKECCVYCGRPFEPDPRAVRVVRGVRRVIQKSCGDAECRRARTRRNLKRWRVLHPDHSARYEGKERAWAKAYPDYWRHYRAEHPEYVARDNQRRVRNRRRAKLSANEIGMRQAVVDNLREVERLSGLGVSANETGILRRVVAIEDCLRSTVAVALSARRNRLVGIARLGG